MESQSDPLVALIKKCSRQIICNIATNPKIKAKKKIKINRFRRLGSGSIGIPRKNSRRRKVRGKSSKIRGSPPQSKIRLKAKTINEIVWMGVKNSLPTYNRRLSRKLGEKVSPKIRRRDRLYLSTKKQIL